VRGTEERAHGPGSVAAAGGRIGGPEVGRGAAQATRPVRATSAYQCAEALGMRASVS